jgi:drug/metabolite transporter (DMT)-like permease
MVHDYNICVWKFSSNTSLAAPFHLTWGAALGDTSPLVFKHPIPARQTIRMTHRRAVALMILATLMWSIAGVVTRHLDAARSFEVSFWRSLFNALALTLALSVMRGPTLWRDMARARWPLWASGVCWSVMFTAFMIAMTLTTVANVLVTLAIGPLITALFARLFLDQSLPLRTWLAIIVAGSGIAWMFAGESISGASPAGTLVALAVPLAAAINWTVLQFVAHGKAGVHAQAPTDMLPAVLIGALLSALATLPLALPWQASTHDLALLALLGVVQLAIPCLLVVRLSRDLPAAEIALLGLLEVLFGVTWAWLGAGEQPTTGTLTGGALVVAALIVNELLELRHGLAAQA